MHAVQSYDVAVARAVADLRVLSELCLPLVRIGGRWVAAKGPSPQAEVDGAARAVKLLGGGPPAVHAVESVAPGGMQRTAVVVAKEGPTPEKYPRRPGLPSKRPL